MAFLANPVSVFTRLSSFITINHYIGFNFSQIIFWQAVLFHMYVRTIHISIPHSFSVKKKFDIPIILYPTKYASKIFLILTPVGQQPWTVLPQLVLFLDWCS